MPELQPMGGPASIVDCCLCGQVGIGVMGGNCCIGCIVKSRHCLNCAGGVSVVIHDLFDDSPVLYGGWHERDCWHYRRAA